MNASAHPAAFARESGLVSGEMAFLFEPTPRRLRVLFNGITLADTTDGWLLLERGRTPVYYFPLSDARMDLLQPSGRVEPCERKGTARYWNLRVGERQAENAAWAYREPPANAPAELADMLAFEWDLMDAWLEEDEQVFGHPRNPYHRVDALRSRRRVQIVLGRQIVADSRDVVFVFETGLPVRYYFPAEDIRPDILQPSERRSRCPYKGLASYRAVELGGVRYGDLVCCYPDPLPEMVAIRGRLAFYNERVDAILIDGNAVARLRGLAS